MQRAPVNALNLELLQELKHAIVACERDQDCRGLLLTSSTPRVFSTGLDVLEMYRPDETRLHFFWEALQDLWLTLYVSPLATAAAITGHSTGAGCLLACSCDYRVMAEGQFTIGMNEAQLGMIPPWWFCETLRHTVGTRQAERLLQTGTLVNPRQALAIGLVDSVVAPEELEATSIAELTKFSSVWTLPRADVKCSLRDQLAERLKDSRNSDLERFMMFCFSPGIQAGIGRYVESLKNKAPES
eukprot:gnl/Spiro4/3139_TR1524_c0_g1_i1.p1 gnl/Spiro4/3139_TR1524_c0_g1~~gnl/Spiro4/3139_TR1524_c0_g1_i1.p1  ORF type:complete len:243 (+),score=70.06 gnl/Spiro4/3139_TR1524_c0_g1_i1:143-871(+)